METAASISTRGSTCAVIRPGAAVSSVVGENTAKGGHTVNAHTVVTLVEVVVVAALVVVLVVRRLVGRPVTLRGALRPPISLILVGILQLGHAPAHLSPQAILALLVMCVVGAGLGALRGSTVQVSVREGFLWSRYRRVTLALWVVSLATRVGIGMAFGGAGGTDGIMLGVGVTLLAEAIVVLVRGRGLGAVAPTVPGARIRVGVR